ncbi:MAG: hypothetical protein GY716_19475 [bacterium]|nr:hypothetical protein [bacterium]
MNGNEKNLDQILDQASAEIAESRLDPQLEKAAAARVWETLSPELSRIDAEDPDQRRIRDCSDFQALIPAYLRDSLNEPKALLLEDHVGECLPCRKALKQARSEQRKRPAARTSAKPTSWRTGAMWKLAVAAVLFVAFVGLSFNTDVFSIQAGGLVHIEEIDGELFQVTEQGSRPLAPGDQVSFEDVSGIRTGKDSRAMFRMADDSVVEMNERSQLTVSNKRPFWRGGDGDAVIGLDRGSIIVEASDQGSGHLYVSTDDADVAVTGTVFAVNHGMKGSRVSVIEGEVEVRHSGNEDVLNAGQQSTTSKQIARTTVADELSWSKNRAKHMALMIEQIRAIREIESVIERPGLRYSTSLLDRAPADTVFYAAIPNLSVQLNQAYGMFQEKVAANELLSQWWEQTMVANGDDREIEELMQRVRTYGDQIGEEVTLVLRKGPGDRMREPLLMAELSSPAAFRNSVGSHLDELRTEGKRIDLQVLEGAVPTISEDFISPDNPGVWLWIHDGAVTLGELDEIRDLAAQSRDSEKAFYGSSFHEKLSDQYSDGVEWILGLNMGLLLEDEQNSEDEQYLEMFGVKDLQHIIAQRKETNDRAENRVVFSFDQQRRGVASWLAEPAPMGSMDFISPDAYVAAGFVMREPVQVVDELFTFMSSAEENFVEELERFQQERGIDIREDIAGALGGEFAIALDGPLLPKPSWKLIMEVYDPVRLQSSIEWAVENLHQLALEAGRLGLSLEGSVTNGRTYYELKSLDTGLSSFHTFVDGYFLAGASKPLLERALKFRASGISLPDSTQFRALLPDDDEVNFSGVLYQNLGGILGRISSFMSSAAGSLPPQHAKILEGLGELDRPTVTLAYGDWDRVTFVNVGQTGIVSSTMAAFLRLETLLNVQQLMGQAAHEKSPAPVDRTPAREEAALQGA